MPCPKAKPQAFWINIVAGESIEKNVRLELTYAGQTPEGAYKPDHIRNGSAFLPTQ